MADELDPKRQNEELGKAAEEDARDTVDDREESEEIDEEDSDDDDAEMDEG
jgi:hypothetical protein